MCNRRTGELRGTEYLFFAKFSWNYFGTSMKKEFRGRS
jgi:hypothetical protein